MSETTEEQKIRDCAYALWQKAGSPEGQEVEFWDQAKELVAKHKDGKDVDSAGEESFPASDAVNRM